tara:strand:- start:1378 stop:1917 length:540 start_codon:yes stop_codon:yes gene_type:complete
MVHKKGCDCPKGSKGSCKKTSDLVGGAMNLISGGGVVAMGGALPQEDFKPKNYSATTTSFFNNHPVDLEDYNWGEGGALPKHLKTALNLHPKQIHALRSVARHLLGEKTILGKHIKGKIPQMSKVYVSDLAELKGAEDLADMIEQEHKSNPKGERIGGNFLDTLGHIAKIGATILPFVL